ncbi:hypothetical protein F5Y13DRAFT_194083 [Hypoxylon sp. FL1857]|nr:hypothetical protein F5Y13DRAFT_194083 [Hypoxylon sp. FL1857]
MQGPDTKAPRVSPTVNSGTWAPVEDARLRDAVAKYGRRWIVVAGAVGTRNGDQCAKRWNENLNPELDHSPWSSQEENLLLHLVDLYGHNWKFMASSFLEGRAPLSLKNRYSLLMRRQKRQGVGTKQLPSPTSTSPTSPSQYNGTFDMTPNFSSNFPFEEVDPRSSSHSRKSYGETDGDLSSREASFDTSPLSRTSSVRELTNMLETTIGTPETQNATYHFSVPTLLGNAILEDSHFDSQATSQTDWWDHSPWAEVADLDPELLDSPDENGVGHNRLPKNTSALIYQNAEFGGALHNRDRAQAMGDESSANKTIQYSVSCQRGKLKTVMCHLVDAAMSETTVRSSEEDEVTLTLRLET